MPPPPLVSVIIPLYNHEAFVGEAIESVLRQTLGNLELIIMDDGSSDGSLEIARRYGDPRIQLHTQTNQGCAAAINHCLLLARGKFLAILNSDDAFMPERLAECVALLDSDPAVAAVFSDINCIDDRGETVQEMSVSRAATHRLPIENDIDERNRMVLCLLAGNFLHSASNLICRREVFEEVGGFRDYRYVQDYEFFLRLAARFQIAVIPKPLLLYRFHDTNTLGENPSLSVAENAAVIATFLHHWRPEPDRKKAGEITTYLIEHMATYGGDRLLCAYLTELYATGSLTEEFAAPARHSEHPSVGKIMTFLDNRRNRSELENSVSWYTRQMNQWWEKAQHLEADITELKQDLSWQSQQTDLWWRAAQALEVEVVGLKQDLTWQSQQTHDWWSAAQKLQDELAYARSNRGQLSIAAEKLRSLFGLAQKSAKPPQP